MPPPDAAAAPGRLVAVGRHQLYVETAGSGTPTVVFEPGLGGVAADWAAMRAAVAAAGFTAIAYDRAGHGRSGPARDARTSEQIARELRRLLRQIAAPPFVLVGQSLGGVHARAYARLFPEDVAGMVLIESSHTRQSQPAPPHFAQRLRGVAWKSAARLARWVRTRSPLPVHDGRAVEAGTAARRLDPRSLAKELRAFQRRAGGPDELAPDALGAKPLIVLTAAPPAAVDERADWQTWHALHADLARLSSNSLHRVAPRGGHDLHRDAPDLVLAAILAVCHGARDGAPLV